MNVASKNQRPINKLSATLKKNRKTDTCTGKIKLIFAIFSPNVTKRLLLGCFLNTAPVLKYKAWYHSPENSLETERTHFSFTIPGWKEKWQYVSSSGFKFYPSYFLLQYTINCSGLNLYVVIKATAATTRSIPCCGVVACVSQWRWKVCQLELKPLVGPPMLQRWKGKLDHLPSRLRGEDRANNSEKTKCITETKNRKNQTYMCRTLHQEGVWRMQWKHDGSWKSDSPTPFLTSKTTTKIATWNTSTMYEAGTAAPVTAEMNNYIVGLSGLGLCETRWTQDKWDCHQEKQFCTEAMRERTVPTLNESPCCWQRNHVECSSAGKQSAPESSPSTLGERWEL